MKSHINEAKFTKRIPTDTYAFEEYTLSAAIDPSESGEDVLIEMRRQVSSAFAADLVESTAQELETKETKKSAKKEEKKDAKSGKSKARPADDEDEDGADEPEAEDGDGEGTDDDEAADDSADDGDHGDAEDGEGDEDGEDDSEEEAPKAAKGKAGKGSPEKGEAKKSFRKKPQTYDREIEQHREIFSGILRSVKPDWKKSDALKARAKKVSEDLAGEEFLDENGDVLESFHDEVKRRMTAKTK